MWINANKMNFPNIDKFPDLSAIRTVLQGKEKKKKISKISKINKKNYELDVNEEE